MAISQVIFPTTRKSLLISHFSFLISHYSLLITHYSLLITHYPLLRLSISAFCRPRVSNRSDA
ncbi:MAG: alpha/beta hydrolase [Rikenellaceae bacterium]|nr:alpha/beta hydrolase [Rikenellaceae bacterium]